MADLESLEERKRRQRQKQEEDRKRREEEARRKAEAARKAAEAKVKREDVPPPKPAPKPPSIKSEPVKPVTPVRQWRSALARPEDYPLTEDNKRRADYYATERISGKNVLPWTSPRERIMPSEIWTPQDAENLGWVQFEDGSWGEPELKAQPFQGLARPRVDTSAPGISASQAGTNTRTTPDILAESAPVNVVGDWSIRDVLRALDQLEMQWMYAPPSAERDDVLERVQTYRRRPQMLSPEERERLAADFLATTRNRTEQDNSYLEIGVTGADTRSVTQWRNEDPSPSRPVMAEREEGITPPSRVEPHKPPLRWRDYDQVNVRPQWNVPPPAADQSVPDQYPALLRRLQVQSWRPEVGQLNELVDMGIENPNELRVARIQAAMELDAQANEQKRRQEAIKKYGQVSLQSQRISEAQSNRNQTLDQQLATQEELARAELYGSPVDRPEYSPALTTPEQERQWAALTLQYDPNETPEAKARREFGVSLVEGGLGLAGSALGAVTGLGNVNLPETLAGKYVEQRAADRAADDLSWMDTIGTAAGNAVDTAFLRGQKEIETIEAPILTSAVEGVTGAQIESNLSIGQSLGVLGGMVNKAANFFLPIFRQDEDAKSLYEMNQEAGTTGFGALQEWGRTQAERLAASNAAIDASTVPNADLALINGISGADAQEQTFRDIQAKANVGELQAQETWLAANGQLNAAEHVRRKRMELEAATYTELVDRNANVAAELVSGSILDPTNIFDIGIGGVVAFKRANDIMAAVNNPSTAGEIATELAKGVNEAVNGVQGAASGYSAIDNTPFFGLIKAAKAYKDKDEVFRSAAQVVAGVTDMRDAEKLVNLWLMNPQALIDGLDARRFVSPKLLEMAGSDGLIRFGENQVANKDLLARSWLTQAVLSEIGNMRAFDGNGVFNPVNFEAELDSILWKKVAERYQLNKKDVLTGIGKVLSMPSDTLRSIMVELNLNFNFAHHVRNALDLNLKLALDDIYSWTPEAEIDSFMNSFFGAGSMDHRLFETNSGVGNAQMLAAWGKNKTPSANPLVRARNAVQNNWMGNTRIGDMPFGEQAGNKIGRYNAFRKNLSPALGRIGKSYQKQLASVGVPEDFAKTLWSSVKSEMMNGGGIGGAQAAWKRAVNGEYLPVDWEALGIPEDVLAPSSYPKLNEIVEWWRKQPDMQGASDEFMNRVNGLLVEEAGRWGKQLQGNPLPIGEHDWTTTTVKLDGAALLDDAQETAAALGVAVPAQAQAEVAEIVSRQQEIVAAAVGEFSGNPDVALDLWSDTQDLRDEARRILDELNADVRNGDYATAEEKAAAWENYWNRSKEVWSDVAAKQDELIAEARSASVSGKEYQRKSTFFDDIQRFINWDTEQIRTVQEGQLFQGTLGSVNDKRFDVVIRGNRLAQDRSRALLYETASRYSSPDTLDIVVSAQKQNDMRGAAVHAWLKPQLEKAQAANTDEAWQEYFKARNKAWQEYFEDSVIIDANAAKLIVLRGSADEIGAQVTWTADGQKWSLLGQSGDGWLVRSADGTQQVVAETDIPAEVVAGYKQVQDSLEERVNGVVADVRSSLAPVDNDLVRFFEEQTDEERAALAAGWAADDADAESLAVAASEGTLPKPDRVGIGEAIADEIDAVQWVEENIPSVLQDVFLEGNPTLDEVKALWDAHNRQNLQGKIARLLKVEDPTPENLAAALRDTFVTDDMTPDALLDALLDARFTQEEAYRLYDVLLPEVAARRAEAIATNGYVSQGGDDIIAYVNGKQVNTATGEILEKPLPDDFVGSAPHVSTELKKAAAKAGKLGEEYMTLQGRLARLDAIADADEIERIEARIAVLEKELYKVDAGEKVAKYQYENAPVSASTPPADVQSLTPGVDSMRADAVGVGNSTRLGVPEGENAAEWTWRQMVQNQNVSPNAHGPNGANLAAHQLERLNGVANSVRKNLEYIAKAQPNTLTPAQRIAAQKLGDQNLTKDLGNLVDAASRAAKRITDMAMLDNTQRRGYDELFSLIFPFSYFRTRSAWNWVKRLGRKPSVANKWYEMKRAIDNENEQSGVPARLEGSIPFIALANGEKLRLQDPLASFFPNAYLGDSRFTNEDEANTTFGKWYNGVRAFAPGMFPHISMLADGIQDELDPLPNGETRFGRNYLGGFVPQLAVAGQAAGAMGFGNLPWSTDNFQDYRIDRAINILGVSGNVPSATVAYARQIVYNTKNGRPAEEGIPPQAFEAANALYQQGVQQASGDRLATIGTRMGTGVGAYVWRDEEQELAKKAEAMFRAGYDPVTNPYGSKADQNAVRAALPEVGNWLNKGANAPAPDPDMRSPVENQRVSEYMTARTKLSEDQQREISYYLSKNPNATEDEIWAIRNKYAEQRKQLDAQYADVEIPEGTMQGMNPREMAQKVIGDFMKYEPPNKPEHPGENASAQAKADYYKARSEWEQKKLAYIDKNARFALQKGQDLFNEQGVLEPWQYELNRLLEGEYAADVERASDNRFRSPLEADWQNQVDFEKEMSAAERAVRAKNVEKMTGYSSDEWAIYAAADAAQKKELAAQNPAYYEMEEAAYHPEEYAEGVELFGDDWFKALQAEPKYPGEATPEYEQAYAEYLKQYPNALEIDLWYNGRPTAYTESPDGYHRSRDYGVQWGYAVERWGEDIFALQRERAEVYATRGKEAGWAWDAAHREQHGRILDFNEWRKALREQDPVFERNNAGSGAAPSVNDYTGARPVGTDMMPIEAAYVPAEESGSVGAPSPSAAQSTQVGGNVAPGAAAGLQQGAAPQPSDPFRDALMAGEWASSSKIYPDGYVHGDDTGQYIGAGKKEQSEAAQQFQNTRNGIYTQFGDTVGYHWDKYNELPKDSDERRAYLDANPELKLALWYGRNAGAYGQAQELFGDDALNAWAFTPADPDARKEYYIQNPMAWAVNVWYWGRFDEEAEGKREPSFGTDWQEAIDLFGADIWNVAMQYRASDKAGRNAMWDDRIGAFWEWFYGPREESATSFAGDDSAPLYNEGDFAWNGQTYNRYGQLLDSNGNVAFGGWPSGGGGGRGGYSGGGGGGVNAPNVYGQDTSVRGTSPRGVRVEEAERANIRQTTTRTPNELGSWRPRSGLGSWRAGNVDKVNVAKAWRS